MLRPLVQNVPEATGTDLSNVVGIPEPVRFQEHFGENKAITLHELRYGNNV